MAIYGRGGNEIELIREATMAELLREWSCPEKPRSKKQREDHKLASERIGYGMMWIGKDKEDGHESIYELAYCKADGGWAEITDARRKIMGEARYAEAAGIPLAV